MHLTDQDPSPSQFRLWSAIALVAGALERRVWAKAAARRTTYPNLYILLTGGPGVGKQVVDTVRGLWSEACEPGSKLPAFHVAPQQMSKASLVDALKKASTTWLPPSGETVTYHSLLIAAEEFQVLLPTYDQEYIATLNQIFNNPALPYTESRRTGSVRELSIPLPQLNILGGVQPSYFVSTFPEEAWSTGLARRIIMVYAAEPHYQPLFQHDDGQDEALHTRLAQQLGQLRMLWGQVTWAPDAAEFLQRWHQTPQGGPPYPTHSKLTHYNNSRTMFLIKLCMVSATARSGGLSVVQSDAERALGWLLGAEARMPDVFREMIGKSDTAVIDELHYFATKLWSSRRLAAKGGPAWLSTAEIWDFLRLRVPSEKIERVLIAADRSGVVQRVAGFEDRWVPKPRHEQVQGVE